MGISQASIFGLTFLTIFVLVLLLKRNRHTEQEVVAYSLSYSEFEEEGHDGRFTLHSVMNPSNGHVSQWLEVSELLHITQTVKKAEEDGNLTVVHVEFPMNNQDYIIMMVKVINYNSQISSTELMRKEKEDSNFWVLISEGALGTNSVIVEINSYINIDVDVEFYGYQLKEVEEVKDSL